MLLPIGATTIIVALAVILAILLATACYKVCPADRVMVITGPGGRRFVSGVAARGTSEE